MRLKSSFDWTVGLELDEARNDFAKQFTAFVAKDEWLTKRVLALLRR